MLSRIADNLFWMSRYLERANSTSRLIGINLVHMVETEDALPETAQWRPMLSITGNEAGFIALHGDGEVKAELAVEYLTREPCNSSSVLNCLRLARENARIVRDRLSKEMWESLNDFWHQIDAQLKKQLPLGAWPEFHKFVRNEVALFHGLALNTMMRGEAFDFYQIGTFLERADMTARILDVKYHLLLPDVSMVGSALDYYQWAALLKSLSGFEAYRRKVHAGFRPVDVAEFVLFEREFPRSLRYCIDRLYASLQSLGASGLRHDSFKIMGALIEEWEHTGIQQVFFENGLHEFLKEFLGRVSSFHEALTRDFFTN